MVYKYHTVSYSKLINSIKENVEDCWYRKNGRCLKMEKTPQEIQKLETQLKEWINRQPHLPQDLDDKTVKRFLHSCYYEMDATKTAVDLFFSLRAASPELINFRDPNSPQMQKALKIINLAQYPISGNRNIWIWQLNDPGLELYDYVQDARLFIMTCDAWILKNDFFEEYDIVVLDVKDITLRFITRFNVSVAKKLMKYQEDAMPIRLKSVHVVNAPPIIDKIFSLMKPFLKQEVIDMIHFHVPNSDTLYNYLSKEDLPSDYGGTRQSMCEFMNQTMEIVKETKDIFLAENFWKTEKKAKGAIEVATFRTLDID